MVFFIRSNNVPEVCISGQSLTWNNNGKALSVYKVPGTINGLNSFNLNDWNSGLGGDWYNWFVNDGTLYKTLN